MVSRRSAPIALLLALAASAVLTTLGRPQPALVLLITTGIGILGTLSLEAALVRILQPGRPRLSRAAAVLLIGHLAIWAVFAAGLYRWRHAIELWAVAVGVGCYLLGLSMGGMNIRGDSPREE
jgi:predicted membrane channel-forming protein YqfA (hemolysin III family)